MSLANYKPVPIDSFGSLLSRVREEAIPLNYAVVAKNIRFKERGIITRPGLTQTLLLPSLTERVTGGGLLVKNGVQIPLFMGSDSNGYHLYYESPAGSGTLLQINGFNHPNRYFDMATAYGRAFIAIGNMQVGLESASQFDGTNFGTVSITPQADPVLVTASATAGNIAQGTRYAVCLFQNIYGGISGVAQAAISSFTAPDGVHKVTVSNIPLSVNPLVDTRIIAFTTAGASQAGPYYYIPFDDVVGSIAISSTVIHDNTTTSATFDFTDEYLQGSEDITSPVDFFDKIAIPFQAAVYYSPTTRRLIWSGGADDETIFRVSEPDDPDTYLGTTGFIKPSQNDGERAITAREFRSQLFLFKEHAGFLALPTDISASNWQVDKRWDRVGPVGPWAVDVSEAFMIFLDRSGVYHYDGDVPICISDEISSSDSALWSRINWAVEDKFWVFIDTDLDEIHVGVALDGSDVPNIVLKLWYLQSFAGGKRKWSVDEISASRIIRIDRNLPPSPNPAVPLDFRIATNQILVLSSNFDSSVCIYDPSSFTDNGNLIDCQYQTGYFEQPGVSQLGGIGLSATGYGDVFVETFQSSVLHKFLPRALPIDPASVTATIIKAQGQSPWWSVKYSNGKNPGNWFEITGGNLYIRQIFKTRRPRHAS